jgi:chitodextrinase
MQRSRGMTRNHIWVAEAKAKANVAKARLEAQGEPTAKHGNAVRVVQAEAASGRTALAFALSAMALHLVAAPLAAFAQTGPVASYAFLEGAGITTADASGSGFTGTLVGGPGWTAGHSNGGLSFNGSTTYVDLGNPAALQVTGSLTVSAWVRETANVADDGQIVAKSDGASGWQLKSTPDTGVRTFGFAITNASRAVIQRYSATGRALDTWYHVAGVYDATARTLDIYVNGVLSDGALDGTVPAALLTAPVNANLGRRSGNSHVAGVIDDVRIYRRALAAAEIQADMSTPVAGGAGDGTAPSVPTGLTASAVSSSAIALGWTASTDGVGVAGYRIYRDGTQVGTSPTATSSDTGLMPSTSYAHAVAAYDAAGNASAQSIGAAATTQASSLDFSLANGGARSVARGNNVTNSVTAALVAGTTTPVTFSATGLGTGMTAAFSPASCAPPCTTTLTLTTAASTPIGTRTIEVTGAGGGVLRTTAFALTVSAGGDTAPPAVALSAPAASALVRGMAVTVSATAVDAGGVAGVQFLLDGANLGAEDSVSPYSIAWNTTTAADGPHLLSARARDAAGNTAATATRTVTVDNALPSGTVVINGGAAATSSQNATLGLSASDATSGVTQMRFSSTGTSYSAAETYATTKAWTLTAGAGTKTVYAQFKDAAGNWSLAATSQVEYGPTAAYGTLSPLDPTLVTSHAVTLGGLASGTYSFRVRSRDVAGNEGLGANGTFALTGPDLTPPTAPASVSAAVQPSEQVLVSWSASTDNVGVAGYQVLRDGLLVGSPTATSLLDAGVLCGATYAYVVRAVDAAGNVSADSSTATVTTPTGADPTPTLVQHVASTSQPVGKGEAGNHYAFTLPSPVLAGNCLILGVARRSGTSFASTPVTDSNGNPWPTTPSAATNAAGDIDLAIFVLPAANAGTTTITVHFTAAIQPFSYTVSEFYGVASSSPVNGSSGASNVSAPNIHTGSFTPGDNNANGGNLIWSFFWADDTFGHEVTTFAAGGPFTLLDANIFWHTDASAHSASEYYVQTTSAPIAA